MMTNWDDLFNRIEKLKFEQDLTLDEIRHVLREDYDDTAFPRRDATFHAAVKQVRDDMNEEWAALTHPERKPTDRDKGYRDALSTYYSSLTAALSAAPQGAPVLIHPGFSVLVKVRDAIKHEADNEEGAEVLHEWAEMITTALDTIPTARPPAPERLGHKGYPGDKPDAPRCLWYMSVIRLRGGDTMRCSKPGRDGTACEGYDDCVDYEPVCRYLQLSDKYIIGRCLNTDASATSCIGRDKCEYYEPVAEFTESDAPESAKDSAAMRRDFEREVTATYDTDVRMCAKCGKHPAEEAQTVCEFCMGVKPDAPEPPTTEEQARWWIEHKAHKPARTLTLADTLAGMHNEKIRAWLADSAQGGE